MEVVRTIASDPAVFQSALGFAASLGKTPVQTSDRGGFIVNRLLVPYMLDAIRGIQRGLDEMKAGKGEPARKVLDRIRAKYKIPHSP